MTLRLHGISTPHDADAPAVLPATIRERLGISEQDLESVTVVRRSVDARGARVRLVYSVDIELRDESAVRDAGLARPKDRPKLDVASGSEPLERPPIVVGAGPAGLFAALLLARHGYRPLVLERGGSIAERKRSLKRFGAERDVDPECNSLFGLGGAGAFSDGKLTTSLSHPWIGALLDELVACGAPPEIRIDSKPHIGTDRLPQVVEQLTASIEAAGGQIRTGVRVERLRSEAGLVRGVETADERLDADIVVAAIGHSARDTIEMLAGAGAAMSPKPFQLGIRVEHPQGWLDRVQFGKAAGHPNLGAAEYKLTTRVDGVPVFSFCMCPGGETMPTVSEPGLLALNGMSNWARDSAFSSSGLVVTIEPERYGGSTPARCLEFVQGIEQAAFVAGGSSYGAPAQRLVDVSAGSDGNSPLPSTSYAPGVVRTSLARLLPSFVIGPLRAALPRFDRSVPGYLHPEAVALAPESRASSPIRIDRDRDSRQSTSIAGLYPVGEGAGHAGGIVSSALDGLNAARRIIERYAPPG